MTFGIGSPPPPPKLSDVLQSRIKECEFFLPLFT